MSGMMWMRMPDQTWFGVATSFVGMWVAMTAAMMLPSLVPVLWRYRASVDTTDWTRLVWLTALVASGYLFVWTLVGVVVFALGVAVVSMKIDHTAAAVAAGTVVLLAGVLQFTTWKAHRLGCCGRCPEPRDVLPATSASAWRHGVRLGVDCVKCCAGLMAIPLALGIMDLRVMLAVAVAITAERIAPAGARVARATGVVIVGVGLLLMAQATGL